MNENYESMPLPALRELAKTQGIRGVSALRKQELIDALKREQLSDKQINIDADLNSTKKTKTSLNHDKLQPKEIKVRTEKQLRFQAIEKNQENEENQAKEKNPVKEMNLGNEQNPVKDVYQIKDESQGNVENQVKEESLIKQSQSDNSKTRERTFRKVETPSHSQHRYQQSNQQSNQQSGQQSNQQNQPTIQQNHQTNQQQSQSNQQIIRRPAMNSSGSNYQQRSENNRTDYNRRNDSIKTENSENNVADNFESNKSSGNKIETVRTDMATVPSEYEQLDSGETKRGILEVLSDGYGFIRCDNFLPGENDVYVSPAQIRRFNLKTGDIIIGNTRVKSQNEKFSALLYVKSINGLHPTEATKRKRFEDLTPIYPNERIHLETSGCGPAMRMVDLICPIGKGQRGMIVSQPKAGKTTLLKQVAKAITRNHSDMHLIVLLIDERPEEVTDMKESIEGGNVEVIYSTFDELPENHKRVSEMVIERAKRLVEHKKDVVILLDSITRLARAYNLTCQSSGRTLSGGLDPAALHMPKKFFGAARNMREGGSLTILATALVETGSRMDDVVFEEFKGTGNMELVLDRSLSEKRIFPAIDLPKSSTRRDDLLLTPAELEANYLMRKALNGVKSDDAVERIVQLFVGTKSNQEFVEMIKKTRL